MTPDTPQIEAILCESEYFNNLDTQARRELASISLPKELKKNDVIFYEGQKGYGFFLLVDSTIQVSKTTKAGKEIVIKVMKPGEVVAEVIFYALKEYPARAQALVKSTVLIIPKKQIEYRIDLSKKDIASAIGATPETFSRFVT